MIFICDAMLGKLAKYLRILGLDTIYVASSTIPDKYKNKNIASYFFTKRKGQKNQDINFICIESNDLAGQLEEIKDVIKPHIDTKQLMKRCIKCNAPLNDIKKDDLENLVPEFIYHSYNIFKICPLCRKIYWEGSHVEHMRKKIKEIFFCKNCL